MNKLPTTIITGFLGSGKTTLLRHLLRHADGRRLAVIVNEFGEVGVDGELLRGCVSDCEQGESTGGGIYELSNGCLCCTVQEEFVPVLGALLERRERIDHIVIETSGLALPKPLVQAFHWPEIRAACTVDAVIALVDGPAIVAGQFAADPHAIEAQRREDPNLDHERPLQELFEDQLSAADLVVVNKLDLLGAGGLERVRARVAAHTRPGVKVIPATQAELPFDLVLGLACASEDAIDQIDTHHDEDHAEGREHNHELFDKLVVRLGTLSRSALLRGLQKVVEEHDVYRAKGFAAVHDKDMRLVVQGVGRRFDSYFDRAWQAHEPRQTELVLIGSHLPRERVEATLKNAISAES